jgi:GGDEF domain-containing protein
MVTDKEASTIGAVFLVAVDGLDEVNRELGFIAGDELLRATAKALTMVFDYGGFQSSVRGHWLARSGGSEFGVLSPGAERDEAKALAATTCNELGPSALADVGLLGAHVGVGYFEGTQTPSDLMAEADMALRRAQGCGHSGWHLYGGDDVRGLWRQGVRKHGARRCRTSSLIAKFHCIFSRSKRPIAVRNFIRKC